MKTESRADSALRRYALLTEYDGTAFRGWQIQPQVRTVQQTLQDALSQLANGPIQLSGCSRTDAGVHARGHVSHFDADLSIPADRLPLALNSLLPPDIAVHAACAADPFFHARFSATGKRYTYQFWRHRIRPVINRRDVSHIAGPLDCAAMEASLDYFIGERDFSALMDQNGSDTCPVRRIDRLTLDVDNHLIRMTVEGSGFLYHMVRILAGTLLAVGQGKIRPEHLPGLLEQKDRRKMGKTMPASGLCLESVFYPDCLF